MNKQTSQIAAGCSGCAALFAIVLACVATGGVPYFYSEVERWEERRSTDMIDGQSDLILMIDEHAIDENTTSMYASGGCAGCSGFMGMLGVAGAIGLFLRSQKQQS